MVTGWKNEKLSNLMIIQTGSRNTEDNKLGGKYPFFVRSQQVERIDSYSYDCEAVLTAGDGVGTGKVFHYIVGKFDVHQRVYVMSNFSGIDGKYFYYFFSENFLGEVYRFTAKSSVDSVRRAMIAEMEVPLPPLPEQQAIATALSDVDGYIAALERLIAKKRNIKKGAMQELLTGKRRLPGFEGEWVEKRIGDIGFTYSGLSGKAKEHFGVGTSRYITFLNVLMNTVIDTTILERVSINENEKQNAVKCGDLFFNTSSETPEEVGMCAVLTKKLSNTYLNSFCFGYRLIDSEINGLYLSYFFNSNLGRKIMSLLAQGATRYNLSKAYFNDTVLSMPSLYEQTAIAAILSDMDAEIDALTAKLIKVRNIKQGMMQELLTGRIRLVDEEAETACVAKTEAKLIELPKRELQPAASQAGGHNQQFDDAVMIAGIVNALYSDKYPLGRKKVQKCLYLLRRHQDESTAAFKKKAAGPYADEVRYKGGEPIARNAKYITTTSTKDKGTTFTCGDNISQALGYIQSWGKQADIQWVADKLKYKKVDELELLTTVDMAICDLEEAGAPISVVSIKHLISTNAEWKAKLKKQSFSDANIARAIKELQTLL
jgi:type I restriction enzyme S subunit